MSRSQATQIHNAQITMFANLLNTMAGSSFTVGVAAPIAAALFYQPPGLQALKVLLGALIWTIIVSLLHLAAQSVLRGLRQ